MLYYDNYYSYITLLLIIIAVIIKKIITGVELLYNSHFGRGSGPILFAYLNCDGTESRLSDCSTYSSYSFGASHSDDAGVRCQRPTTTSKHDHTVTLTNYNISCKFSSS